MTADHNHIAAELVDEWQKEFNVRLKDWVSGELMRRIATAIVEYKKVPQSPP